MEYHNTRHLPRALYRAQQVCELDRIAIEEQGIPGWDLMQRAGRAAFRVLRRTWPQARTIAVLCGAGNNGGDGYVVAREALDAGFRVVVASLVDETRLRGDALSAYRSFREHGGRTTPFHPGVLAGFEILVDAIFGTGLDRPVEGRFAEAIEAANRFPGGVLALDIPSGLNADSGRSMGVAVEADCTVTFIGLKRGLFTGEAADFCGRVLFSSLDVPPAVYRRVVSEAELLDLNELLLPPRRRSAHKGRFGHVLVVGGEAGFSGAAWLAGEAAARVGAGLVSVATRPAHAGYLNVARPELMCHGIDRPSDLEPLLSRATVVAVGPGMGRSPWASSLFEAAVSSGLPVVVDADGLNLLAQAPRRCDRWVLTPHPGEAARLLGSAVAAVEADRFDAAAALQFRYGGTVVLKGAGTLVASENGPTSVVSTGNPGMASGGMGDVLTGVIAGLVAQCGSLDHAARLGVCLHGAAADRAAAEGERGLLASDLMHHLRALLNS